MANEYWKAVHSFGSDAVAALAGAGGDLQAPLSDAQVAQIAARSTVQYFTDGARLWTIEGQAAAAPGTRPVTPAEALRAFGLEKLLESREYGSTT